MTFPGMEPLTCPVCRGDLTKCPGTGPAAIPFRCSCGAEVTAATCGICGSSRNQSRKTFEAMQYTGFDSYHRIIAWAKEKGDTTALANEWIFRTPILTFPADDGRFKAAIPGDWIVWNGTGFRVWSERV
jgi:hypothetical protein